MKFPPEFLDEIRARLPVSEVAGTRVKLRKEGREWRGLSPFTAEKTPSFFVNDQKGFFHDFSSGKHGDAFAFLMETEGLTFPEAVERLAGMAGLPMPRLSQAEAVQDKKRASLIDVMAMAARLFEANLQQPIGARGARLSRRSRPWAPGAAALWARLRLARALRAARRAGRPGRRRRGDDRSGPARPRGRHRRSLRPVPRPGDVSDPRPRGPRHRLRRAGDGGRAPRRNTSIRRRPRSSTRARCCSIITAPARPRMTRARSSWSRATSTRSR